MINTWQPTATLANLRLRARMLAQIRDFFAARNVLEVETPLLSQHTVTDLHIESFATASYYLQTSPEYAMKRLLAAGSGPIYQICKAFRYNESGHQHNPEFSMLEWYRPGFNHHDLMDEMDALLQRLLQTSAAERVTYQQLFLTHFNLDPHQCDLTTLQQCAARHQLTLSSAINDKDTLLQLLLSHVVEPQLGVTAPVFIYDFPASQAALAKVTHDDPPLAERFEVYVKGFELANGFHELSDATEQLQRFRCEQARRKQQGRAVPAIDQRLIAALQHGLPACAGVALGLDRLAMLLASSNSIDEVLTFPWERA